LTALPFLPPLPALTPLGLVLEAVTFFEPAFLETVLLEVFPPLVLLLFETPVFAFLPPLVDLVALDLGATFEVILDLIMAFLVEATFFEPAFLVAAALEFFAPLVLLVFEMVLLGFLPLLDLVTLGLVAFLAAVTFFEPAFLETTALEALGFFAPLVLLAFETVLFVFLPPLDLVAFETLDLVAFLVEVVFLEPTFLEIAPLEFFAPLVLLVFETPVFAFLTPLVDLVAFLEGATFFELDFLEVAPLETLGFFAPLVLLAFEMPFFDMVTLDLGLAFETLDLVPFLAAATFLESDFFDTAVLGSFFVPLVLLIFETPVLDFLPPLVTLLALDFGLTPLVLDLGAAFETLDLVPFLAGVAFLEPVFFDTEALEVFAFFVPLEVLPVFFETPCLDCLRPLVNLVEAFEVLDLLAEVAFLEPVFFDALLLELLEVFATLEVLPVFFEMPVFDLVTLDLVLLGLEVAFDVFPFLEGATFLDPDFFDVALLEPFVTLEVLPVFEKPFFDFLPPFLDLVDPALTPLVFLPFREDVFLEPDFFDAAELFPLVFVETPLLDFLCPFVALVIPDFCLRVLGLEALVLASLDFDDEALEVFLVLERDPGRLDDLPVAFDLASLVFDAFEVLVLESLLALCFGVLDTFEDFCDFPCLEVLEFLDLEGLDDFDLPALDFLSDLDGAESLDFPSFEGLDESPKERSSLPEMLMLISLWIEIWSDLETSGDVGVETLLELGTSDTFGLLISETRDDLGTGTTTGILILGPELLVFESFDFFESDEALPALDVLDALTLESLPGLAGSDLEVFSVFESFPGLEFEEDWDGLVSGSLSEFAGPVLEVFPVFVSLGDFEGFDILVLESLSELPVFGDVDGAELLPFLEGLDLALGATWKTR
jgi:hypothetical protein